MSDFIGIGGSGVEPNCEVCSLHLRRSGIMEYARSVRQRSKGERNTLDEKEPRGEARRQARDVQMRQGLIACMADAPQ